MKPWNGGEMKIPIDRIAPTRYYSRTVDLTFWQALKRFIKYREWSWQKIEFDAVHKGDPRYDSAPYEERIVAYEGFVTTIKK